MYGTKEPYTNYSSQSSFYTVCGLKRTIGRETRLSHVIIGVERQAQFFTAALGTFFRYPQIMTSLITDIGRKVFKKAFPFGPRKNEQLDIVKFRKALLDALTESMQNKTAIGIYSPVLGEGMFVTSVFDIYDYGGEQIIEFEPYDISGIILIRSSVSISEIKAACVFDMLYRNPVKPSFHI